MTRRADTDVDIDFQDPSAALEGLDYVRAILIDDDGNTRPHTSGIYFQDIPVDPITNMCTIDSKAAEDRGYFKIDFLFLLFAFLTFQLFQSMHQHHSYLKTVVIHPCLPLGRNFVELGTLFYCVFFRLVL